MNVEDINDTLPMIEDEVGADMDQSSLLITGIGGVGSRWATNAIIKCEGRADLLLIDGDPVSFTYNGDAHRLPLNNDGSENGCASLSKMAESRMHSLSRLMKRILEPAELVILLVGLGGGCGGGASIEFAKQVKREGALLLTIAGMPFSSQPLRRNIAAEAFTTLSSHSDLCIKVEFDQLAQRARERGVNWLDGGAWVAELVEGLATTLSATGLMNLDLMDLRTTIKPEGSATMLVGEGRPDRPTELVKSVLNAPLTNADVKGAKSCLLQLEGGPDMTLGQLDDVADAFTADLDRDALVILGARVDESLLGVMRVVAVLSGIE